MNKSGPKPQINRIGEQRIMKNGLVATLIEYRSSASVDVQFEDGVVIKNKTYAQFNEGKIGHPDCLHINKRKNRVGECNIMSNGMKAKITKYESSANMTVEFEDGAIREHCAYREFKKGQIKHPKDTQSYHKQTRLGEQRYMSCGMKATIIRYDAYHDIDIKFEDGNVINGTDYGLFKRRSIAHPDDKAIFESLQEVAIGYYLSKFGFRKTGRGELKELGFGQMQLDFYNKEKKIAVEVDGAVHNFDGQFERDLRKNKVCFENNIKLYRLRDKTLKYIENSTSCDYILNGTQYMVGLIDCANELYDILSSNNFCIKDNTLDFERDFDEIMEFYCETMKNYYFKKRIGEKIFHKTTQQYMTIIDYVDYHRLTIQFDDGAIVKNKNYDAFKNGTIRHPSMTQSSQKNNRIGEKRKMHCGSIAEIIAYRNSEDIDIKFDDGTVVENVTYYNFFKETILNPNIAHTQAATNRIGETNIMSCGQKATIIAYRNQSDMDIQFEDGTIKEGVQYSKFQSGYISHPQNIPSEKAKQRIGECRQMNCGVYATIIEYRTSHDIDIEFENGVIVQHKKYSLFISGSIGYKK